MAELETATAQDIFLEEAGEARSGTELARGLEEQARRFGEQAVDLPELTTTLISTAQEIRVTIGDTQIGELEPGVAGQAMQGQQGSSIIDVTAAVAEGGTQVIDVTQLEDAVKHEEEHERQAAVWNAEVVSIGNGKTLSRHEVSETGSMSVQSNLNWVSSEYKQMYQYVVSHVSSERAREAAREGDLVGLGEEIREKAVAQ